MYFQGDRGLRGLVGPLGPKGQQVSPGFLLLTKKTSSY